MKFILFYFILLVVNISGQTAPLIAVKNKKNVDFGTFPANKKQSTTFIIKNIGDEVLKIIRVRKTCKRGTALPDRVNLKKRKLEALLST